MKSKNTLYEAKEFKNLKELMKDAIEKYASHKAFIIKNKEKSKEKYTNISYEQFGLDIDSLGSSLIKRGLKNKRIAVISPNRYEWVVSYFAVVNGTGIVVPLDKGLPDNEIESLLQRSNADAVIFDEKYYNIMKQIQEQKSTAVSMFICMDKTEDFLCLKELIEEGKNLLEQGYEEFTKAEINEEKMQIILFTSGTTSASKAVMLSHKNIASNIYALSMAEKVYDTDVNLAFLPFHHTFGSTALFFFLSKRNYKCILRWNSPYSN